MTPDRWPAWRPISTAPRDGTRVLVWDLEDGEPVFAMWGDLEDGGEGWMHADAGWFIKTDYWLPEPQAPDAADG